MFLHGSLKIQMAHLRHPIMALANVYHAEKRTFRNRVLPRGEGLKAGEHNEEAFRAPELAITPMTQRPSKSICSHSLDSWAIVQAMSGTSSLPPPTHPPTQIGRQWSRLFVQTG